MARRSKATVEAAAPVTPDLERSVVKAESRRGFLLALPGYAYLIIFFAVPMLIILVYSFGTRSATGKTILGDWNLDSYRRLFDHLVLGVMWRSLWLALATTVICLLISYPFAYYIATRGPRLRGLLMVLVMIPFWTNFLVRTYAWRLILGRSGPLSVLLGWIGLHEARLLFTNGGILIGLVYGHLPFMVLPLYAAIERLDWNLVEAARDLYAGSWKAFRKVTLPLSMAGVVGGTILTFIPAFGAYIEPELLGGAQTMMLGSFIQKQYYAVSDWPFGSALSFVIMALMLAGTILYFRKGGRTA
jgi:spermidine/putrescine transport system permease protein